MYVTFLIFRWLWLCGETGSGGGAVAETVDVYAWNLRNLKKIKSIFTTIHIYFNAHVYVSYYLLSWTTV